MVDIENYNERYQIFIKIWQFCDQIFLPDPVHLEVRCGGFLVLFVFFIILNIYKGNPAFMITNLSFEF